MIINLESTYYISNSDYYLHPQERSMLTKIDTKITTLTFDEEDESVETEIGYIKAWRFNLSCSNGQLYQFADAIGGDIGKVGEYFFSEHHDEGLIVEELTWRYDYLFYIDSLVIEPPYRGKNIGLKALGLFLLSSAQGQIVSAIPFPITERKNRTREQTKVTLKHYWSKLNLSYHSEDYNLLWEADWQIPNWIEDCLWKQV